MLIAFQLVAALLLSAVGSGRTCSCDDKRRALEEQLKKLQTDLEETNQTLSSLNRKLGRNGLAHTIEKRSTNLTDLEYDEMLSKLPLDTFSALKGPPGRDGRNGRDGTPGRDGLPGVTGMPGMPGMHGLPGLNGRDCSGNRTSNSESLLATAGGVYVRWGRTSCGSQSSLVYSGFAGSAAYTHSGGGVNFQCLPDEPEYNSYSGNVANWAGSRLNGAEYQTYRYGIFPDGTYNQNVPCARCYTNSRPAIMMIPAKKTCPAGWTAEYDGYLMAGKDNQAHPTTYECVDARPEYIEGLHANTNGALLYFVKVDCYGTGSISHCPPYVAQRELTCVVCTK